MPLQKDLGLRSPYLPYSTVESFAAPPPASAQARGGWMAGPAACHGDGGVVTRRTARREATPQHLPSPWQGFVPKYFFSSVRRGNENLRCHYSLTEGKLDAPG